MRLAGLRFASRLRFPEAWIAAEPSLHIAGSSVVVAKPRESSLVVPQRLYAYLFAAWLVLRSAAWVAVILLFQPNARLDTIEWASWSNVTQWGYPKHPPLPAWMVGMAMSVDPGAMWPVYLLSYAVTAAALVGAWCMARQYLTAPRAFFAVLALDGLYFVSCGPADYSNNIVLNALWTWSIFFAHRALFTNRLRWWLALGITVGLAGLTKYTIAFLLAPLLLLVITDSGLRRRLRSPGLYLSAAIALAMVAPHLHWLAKHDFMTLQYASDRSIDVPGLMSHVKNPLLFLVSQGVWLVPVAFILWPLLGRRSSESGEASSRRFLHMALWGPIAVHLAISAITGCQLRMIWGYALWTLFGVWLLATFPGSLTAEAASRLLRRWALMTIASLLAFVAQMHLEPHLSGIPGRHLFPGKELADEVARRWHEQHDDPIPIVAGEPWRAGNVCCYLPNRPCLFSSGSMGYLWMMEKDTPWTSDADLATRGGVILWDADQLGDELHLAIRRRFPQAESQPPILLPHHTSAKVEPARVGVAFVTPKQ